jgi:hypothetical protein
MKKELLIGKIGNDKVILEIELKDKPITQGSAITTALTPITEPTYKVLSITGSIGNNHCGQIYDSIDPSEFDELYIDRDQLIHLIAIWKSCHLNDMCAGSLKQMELIDFWRDQIKSTSGWDYNEVCAMLEQHGLLIDNETNPDLNVGYHYGTLWLVNLLPQSVIDFIQNLNPTPPTKTRSAILDYLIDNKYTWDIRLTSNNPNMQSDTEMDHWKVKLFNQFNDEFKVYFSTGIGHRLMSKDKWPNQFKTGRLLTNWKNKTIRMMGFKPKQTRGGHVTDDYKTVQELGFYPPPIGSVSKTSNIPFQGVRVPPIPDQVIECICSDWLSIENYHSWEDWGKDLGYDLNSKSDRQKARRTYENVIDQSDEAQEFFGSDWNELCNRSY